MTLMDPESLRHFNCNINQGDFCPCRDSGGHGFELHDSSPGQNVQAGAGRVRESVAQGREAPAAPGGRGDEYPELVSDKQDHSRKSLFCVSSSAPDVEQLEAVQRKAARR